MRNKYTKHDVSVSYSENESKAILDSISNLNIENEITTDDVVVIIPNWVNNDKPNPQDGVVVGPESLRTIIKWAKKNNPKRVVVATGSGSKSTKTVMKQVGYDKIISEENIEFIDFNSGPYTKLKLNNKKPCVIDINTILDEVTYLISFTQLKVHEEATMSASIKNMALSIPSSEQHGSPKKNLGIHDDLHSFIAAMAEKICINLSIVSANPVMIGTGPTKGIQRHTGLVISGCNPLSVDCICARLLGFKEQGVNYLHLLKNRGYLETDILKIPMKGLSLYEIERIFTSKVYCDEMIMDN